MDVAPVRSSSCAVWRARPKKTKRGIHLEVILHVVVFSLCAIRTLDTDSVTSRIRFHHRRHHHYPHHCRRRYVRFQLSPLSSVPPFVIYQFIHLEAKPGPHLGSNSASATGIHKIFIAPAGFLPRGQNPRRHPRIPLVYAYKDKEYLLLKK